MKLGVLIPSRGLIHSRTIESIEQNLEEITGWEIKRFFSHDLPIPNAQNSVAERAYEWGADLFWFVEEDNVVLPKTLEKMVEALTLHDAQVVAADYAVGEKKFSTMAIKEGRVIWCGFGCTLVKAIVFDKLERPWFRTNKSYLIKDLKTLELEEQDVPNKYGGHDIDFGIRVNKLGFNIYKLPDVICGHARLSEWGKLGINNGAHKVEIWDTIENYQNY